MSNRIDVTITGADPSWSVTIDAATGLSTVTGTGHTMAEAVENARDTAQLAIVAAAKEAGLYGGPQTLALIEMQLRSACSVAMASYGQSGPLYTTPPLFGTDVSTIPDIDPTFGWISGQRVVAEAIYRRLITDNGRLLYDSEYGYDVRALLNAGITNAQLATIQAQIQAQAELDERVLSAEANVTLITATNSLLCRVTITTSTGPFVLVITVDKLRTDVTLLGV